jgi:transcriptional regulator with XRE-family HTH domain
MNALAQKIRELRLKAKLSEKQLAKKAGLAESYILQIETGKKVINESSAEKIFAALGEKPDFGFNEEPAEPIHSKSQPAPRPEIKKQTTVLPAYVEPQNQWADALSNIIRTYPIYALGTKQIVGKKELPIIGKKVEGYGLDKIMFVQIQQNDLSGFRLLKGDVILIELTKDLPQQGLYLIEEKNVQQICYVQREPGNKYTLSNGVKDEPKQTIDAKLITIVGRCVRAEFSL